MENNTGHQSSKPQISKDHYSKQPVSGYHTFQGTGTAKRKRLVMMSLARMRTVSGSILFLFLTCHLTNHIFGLISFDAMEQAHGVLMEVWRTVPGTILLGSAFLVHFSVAILAIYRRRTLKMTLWEASQLSTGLIIPFLLAEHVLGTRVAEEIGEIDMSYRLVIAALWVVSPVNGIIQAVLSIVAWVHGCIGLNLWLGTKNWYVNWRRQLLVFAIALPTLSMAGYVSAGFEVLSELDRDHMVNAIFAQAQVDPVKLAPIKQALMPVLLGFAALSFLPFLGRVLREKLASRSQILLLLPDASQVPVPSGATALEALRAQGRPHAAVCGGRGRCTTCRVRVIQGAGLLAPPEDLEAAALARIKALDGVRLACQIRPKTDLGISPLLPPTATAKDGKQLGGLEGEEKRITCIFIDIRKSTKLGEEKLPYDVLFILNQFFSEMSQAISETGGHYAQFNGDGLMALYGLDGGEAEGAKAALAGARAMLDRVERLNHALETELPFPLEVGIGLHHGEAIVGAMGPPRAQITSAIGDTINTTARLESLTKEHGRPIIFSEEVARAAGIDTAPLTRAEVVVRGRTTPVAFFPVTVEDLQPA